MMELLCTVPPFFYPFSLFIILFVLSGHETDSLVSTSRLVEIWRLHPKQKAKTKSHWSVHRFVFAFANHHHSSHLPPVCSDCLTVGFVPRAISPLTLHLHHHIPTSLPPPVLLSAKLSPEQLPRCLDRHTKQRLVAKVAIGGR